MNQYKRLTIPEAVKLKDFLARLCYDLEKYRGQSAEDELYYQIIRQAYQVIREWIKCGMERADDIELGGYTLCANCQKVYKDGAGHECKK